MAQLVEALRYKPECHWHNPSGRNMALGSTQRLTEISIRNISWGGGKGGRCVGLTTLSHSCVDCLEILRASNSCFPVGLEQGLLYLICMLQNHASYPSRYHQTNCIWWSLKSHHIPYCVVLFVLHHCLPLRSKFHSTRHLTLSVCVQCVLDWILLFSYFLLITKKHIESNYITQRNDNVAVHTLMPDTRFHTHTEVHLYTFQSPR